MSSEESHQSQTVQPVSKEEKEIHQNFDESIHKPHSPRWKKFVVPIGVGLAVIGGVGWIVFNRVILPIMIFSQMKPPPLTQVPLANPKSATIEDSSDYAANLDSRQSIILQPRVSGQVSAIYVKAGDRVQAGEQILQIDAAEQQAQVASRTAAIETAAADIEAARADVANATDALNAQQARRTAALSDVQLNRQEYKRYQNLYSEGAESKQILDQKLNALQTAQATLLQVEADIRAQQSAINRAKATVVKNQRALQQTQANFAEGKAQLQYYTIKAPFTGVVGNIPIKVGDFVDTPTQLLTITQNQELEIQIAIPLERTADLRQGLPVKLLDAQDQVLQTGLISFIAPNVDPSTQSVQVKAVFQNLGDRLRTAQFVRARVVWEKRPGVLVPTTAISRLGGKDFVFVAAPFQSSGCKEPAQSDSGGPTKIEPDQLVAVQKLIMLGKIVGNDQEILEGVSQRDRIVVAGILQLQNCTPIAEGTLSAQ
jgi:multidrug efflux pump subunit AcrA (membrane-fusion protein)